MFVGVLSLPVYCYIRATLLKIQNENVSVHLGYILNARISMLHAFLVKLVQNRYEARSISLPFFCGPIDPER